jgi:four helix bundle protein
VWHFDRSNAEEAQDAQTKPDFVAKLSVSRKEGRETRYWLRLAIRMGAVTLEEAKWELDEVDQLRSMIISAVKTAQASSSRGK